MENMMPQATTSLFLILGITDGSPQSQDRQTAEALLTNGLDFLYWRRPSDPALPKQLPASVQASVLLPANQANEVTAPFRWHLTDTARQRRPYGQPGAFSTSIHTLSEWSSLAGQVELVFYSPVFPSISKPGYGPSIGLEEITRQIRTIRKQQTTLPLLIGLGGVNADNVAQVRQAGFDGAAVMGALWQPPDALDALNQLQQALANHERMER
jgi:thiamine-phosphate pyrophosphorylase